MTNKEMLCTALKQTALERNCTVDNLTSGKSKAVISSTAEGARKYLSLPFYCQLVSYGSGIVASVNEEIYADAKAYIEKYAPEHCFETPNMLVLQSALERRGMSACFMAEYWLCDTDAIRMIDCGYELRRRYKSVGRKTQSGYSVPYQPSEVYRRGFCAAVYAAMEQRIVRKAKGA